MGLEDSMFELFCNSVRILFERLNYHKSNENLEKVLFLKNYFKISCIENLKQLFFYFNNLIANSGNKEVRQQAVFFSLRILNQSLELFQIQDLTEISVYILEENSPKEEFLILKALCKKFKIDISKILDLAFFKMENL